MVSKYQLSRGGLQELLKEHFQFSVGLGAIFKKQKIVNEVLASPVAALLPMIKENQKCVHIDETGHREAGQRAWMWVIASQIAVYYEIVHSRGVKVLKNWMHDFNSIVVSVRVNIGNYAGVISNEILPDWLKKESH